MPQSTQLLWASGVALVVYFVLFFTWQAGLSQPQRAAFVSGKPGKLTNLLVALPLAALVVLGNGPIVPIAAAVFAPIAAILTWMQVRSLRVQGFDRRSLTRYVAISAIAGVALLLFIWAKSAVALLP